MGLLSYTGHGKDVFLNVTRIENYRKFCNKLWNGFKISLVFIDHYVPQKKEKISGSKMDLWILHKVNFLIKEVHESFKLNDFSRATDALYKFWWHEYCDVYLEVIKPFFMAIIVIILINKML